jgi:HAD superfamily hydrolase (TIGR01509 family)
MGLYVNLRVKALIFDIDGTLGDTMPAHWKAWSETGRKYGFDYPKELFYQNAGMPSRAIVALINRDYGLRLDPEQVTAAKDAAYLRHIREVQPLEPVVALVHKFHGHLPMGLGTGECRKIALQNIRALGLQKYFAALVSCDDVTQPKPDPETFLRCADRLGVAPEYCQVFEDGELGLEAARRAGMIATDVRPFLIPSGAEGPEAHSQKLRVS